MTQGKSFEQQFPSLKGKEKCHQGYCTHTVCKDEFTQEDIQQHCIDKQKVREIIDKLSKEGSEEGCGINEFQLREELGL